MSFWTLDHDKRIRRVYWVYLEGVSLDFDSSWMGWEVEISKKHKSWGIHEVVKGCRRWVGPRSLEWMPLTQCDVDENEDLLVRYGEGDVNDGSSHTSVIAGWDVKALAQGAEYQDGGAHLEIKGDFRCGASTVRLFVHKAHQYEEGGMFKLSVVIENIHRDEWDELLKYQQQLTERGESIVTDVPYTFRGNERVIEQTPEFWPDDRDDVTNDVRHVADGSLPLVFKYHYAQSGAIQRGLSWGDFLWEFPNHHETRVVRPPSAHTDTALRAIRLDITISSTYGYMPLVDLYISSIKLQMTAITRSPSLPNILHNTTFRLDARYAALANATIPNHSSQITEIPTGSQSANHIITSSGPIHVNGPLQIMGSMMGDMYTGPISGGNVGGRNNLNHFTAPLTAEAVASAVVRALDSRPCDGGRFVPQPEVGRKRKRDDEEDIEDIEGPSKRQFRPTSFISRFFAALFSA